MPREIFRFSVVIIEWITKHCFLNDTQLFYRAKSMSRKHCPQDLTNTNLNHLQEEGFLSPVWPPTYNSERHLDHSLISKWMELLQFSLLFMLISNCRLMSLSGSYLGSQIAVEKVMLKSRKGRIYSFIALYLGHIKS